MRHHWITIVLLPLLWGSCRPQKTTQALGDRAATERELSVWSNFWLAPARVAPPTIDWERSESKVGELTASVTPFRAEDARWNQWPGELFRLFNNRAGFFFEVEVSGSEALRWVPELTKLVVNGGQSTLYPAHRADEMLVPLAQAALAQESMVLSGDFVDRHRAAGPFRSAYLPLEISDEVLSGIVCFPMADPEMHVVKIEVVIAVASGQSSHQLTWTLD